MLLLAALAVFVSGHAEGNLSEGFLSFITSFYTDRGGEIVSASECVPSGAVIVRQDGNCFLAVLFCEDGQWAVRFENDRAASETSRVLLDTEDELILIDPFGRNDETVEQYYFRFTDDWILSSVIRYEGIADEQTPAEEYLAWFADGMLLTQTAYTDENGNILALKDRMPLPDVLTEDERSLKSFDACEPAVNGLGYLTDDSMCISDAILQRLFSVSQPEGCSYADGYLNDDGLQFIADKVDGTRVLLCREYAADGSCTQTESTPLPAGTVMGIENFTGTLNLGRQGYGVSIGKYADGTWGAKGILADEWFAMGECWVSAGFLWWDSSPAIGDTPWHDMTRTDWSTIPKTLDEARLMLDTSGWATPDNSDPRDRLHLRAGPGKGSKSLGKYYNGTPVRVLDRGETWTKVQIGSATGYMMTDYLLFGDPVNTRSTALFGKTNVHPMTEILWEDSEKPVKIPGNEVAGLLITGVIGNEWYLVWEPDTNRHGRIRQSELWDGNG